MVDAAMMPALREGACPHLAVLLRTADELPPVLASFYALGAERGGWLVHRALPGNADAERLALSAAGLDVAGLEADERLVVSELDPELPSASYGRAWEPAFQRALDRGFSAMWYSRFAVGGEVASYETVLDYDREWEAWFRGRQVVTLCPFVVGQLDALGTLDRLTSLAEFHDGFLVADGDGAVLYETASVAAGR
jgi:hypothetical protein